MRVCDRRTRRAGYKDEPRFLQIDTKVDPRCRCRYRSSVSYKDRCKYLSHIYIYIKSAGAGAGIGQRSISDVNGYYNEYVKFVTYGLLEIISRGTSIDV